MVFIDSMLWYLQIYVGTTMVSNFSSRILLAMSRDMLFMTAPTLKKIHQQPSQTYLDLGPNPFN